MMTCDTCNRAERKGKEETESGVAGTQETAVYIGETHRSSYERGREPRTRPRLRPATCGNTTPSL